MPVTPSVARQRARIAALTRWSRLGAAERRSATTKAREGFRARFDHEANPEAAMRAHMARLALKSTRGRR